MGSPKLYAPLTPSFLPLFSKNKLTISGLAASTIWEHERYPFYIQKIYLSTVRNSTQKIYASRLVSNAHNNALDCCVYETESMMRLEHVHMDFGYSKQNSFKTLKIFFVFFFLFFFFFFFFAEVQNSIIWNPI